MLVITRLLSRELPYCESHEDYCASRLGWWRLSSAADAAAADAAAAGAGRISVRVEVEAAVDGGTGSIGIGL